MAFNLKTILMAGAIFLSTGAQAASSAFEITDKMMPGWNLGNSLDAVGGETNWGNPVTTKAMIDKVKSAGFKTLRVPVRWDDYTSGAEHSIASARLDRVEEVINYGLANDMYVIVNVYHTNGWIAPTYANEANAKNRLTKLWQQIATRFKAYDDHLIFETMNEPRSGDDWWGNDELCAVVNNLNAAALSTIRATGGNNASRLVMLPSYVASTYNQQLDRVKMPADRMAALSVHAYLPFDFAMEAGGTSSFTNTALLDELFARLNTMFVAKGVAVVMGEWGSTNKNNTAERIKHAEYYTKAAAKVKIPVVVWDNNAYNAGAEAFGLLNRSALTWTYPEVITAIMKGASGMSASSSVAASSVAASSKAAVSSAAAASSKAAVSSSAAASSKAASSVAVSSVAASSKAAVSSSAAASSKAAASSSAAATGSGVTATVSINNDWGSGYCASLLVKNAGSAVTSWATTVSVAGKVNQLWNATWSQSGSTLNIAGSGWSGNLAAGATSSSIGFCATR